MTYLIKYLGEFEFIFETVLDYVSGGLMGSFEAKNTESKISCLGTFNIVQVQRLNEHIHNDVNSKLYDEL